MIYSTRIFGKETAGKAVFAVKEFADYNHLCQRFFLESITIEVPHGHPRRPLTEDQRKILDAHVVVTDGNDSYDFLVKDTLNPNMFDLGVFIIRPDHLLHLSPEDTITVDVHAKADFFFYIDASIRPL